MMCDVPSLLIIMFFYLELSVVAFDVIWLGKLCLLRASDPVKLYFGSLGGVM